MNRRSALGALGAAALAGCGFELRRAPELRFRSIALAGFKPKSTLADELRHQMVDQGTFLVPTLLETMAPVTATPAGAAKSAKTGSPQTRRRAAFRVSRRPRPHQGIGDRRIKPRKPTLIKPRRDHSRGRFFRLGNRQ